ncbi:spherulation-specific family 4 protein [Streptomyces sp. NPDC058657]|uniref:spherulation-specific family 4 protein n=1 Tax=unclassified Streptomyces TaxID=2593676 RepID=UPI00364DC98F
MSLPPTMGAGVPLYIHPATDSAAWANVAIPDSPVHWVILNQNSGPGETEDAVLYDAARAVRDAGTPVLGYIPLDYGERDDYFNNLEAESYVTRGITKVFLDECPSDAAHVQSTALTILRQRQRGMTYVVINPGQITDRRYLGIADQVVTFEGDLATYRTAVFPDWVREYPPERFAHMLHGVETAEQAAEAVGLARRRNCHTVFVHSTPFVPQTNTWDGLPSYWQAFTRALGNVPSRPAPGWQR